MRKTHLTRQHIIIKHNHILTVKAFRSLGFFHSLSEWLMYTNIVLENNDSERVNKFVELKRMF